jgi:hypothetical protein
MMRVLLDARLLHAVVMPPTGVMRRPSLYFFKVIDQEPKSFPFNVNLPDAAFLLTVPVYT